MRLAMLIALALALAAHANAEVNSSEVVWHEHAFPEFALALGVPGEGEVSLRQRRGYLSFEWMSSEAYLQVRLLTEDEVTTWNSTSLAAFIPELISDLSENENTIQVVETAPTEFAGRTWLTIAQIRGYPDDDPDRTLYFLTTRRNRLYQLSINYELPDEAAALAIVQAILARVAIEPDPALTAAEYEVHTAGEFGISLTLPAGGVFEPAPASSGDDLYEDLIRTAALWSHPTLPLQVLGLEVLEAPRYTEERIMELRLEIDLDDFDSQGEAWFEEVAGRNWLRQHLLPAVTNTEMVGVEGVRNEVFAEGRLYSLYAFYAAEERDLAEAQLSQVLADIEIHPTEPRVVGRTLVRLPEIGVSFYIPEGGQLLSDTSHQAGMPVHVTLHAAWVGMQTELQAFLIGDISGEEVSGTAADVLSENLPLFAEALAGGAEMELAETWETRQVGNARWHGVTLDSDELRAQAMRLHVFLGLRDLDGLLLAEPDGRLYFLAYLAESSPEGTQLVGDLLRTVRFD